LTLELQVPLRSLSNCGTLVVVKSAGGAPLKPSLAGGGRGTCRSSPKILQPALFIRCSLALNFEPLTHQIGTFEPGTSCQWSRTDPCHIEGCLPASAPVLRARAQVLSRNCPMPGFSCIYSVEACKQEGRGHSRREEKEGLPFGETMGFGVGFRQQQSIGIVAPSLEM
jgi:hypothetical protein